jgi:hypothetical protein
MDALPNMPENGGYNAQDGAAFATPGNRLEQTQEMSGVKLERLNSEIKTEMPDFKKMFEK